MSDSGGAVEQVVGGQVDGDPRSMPVLVASRGRRDAAWSSTQLGERLDQAGVLGDGDELVGAEHAERRVVPAHECLERRTIRRSEVELRLVQRRRSRAVIAARRSRASATAPAGDGIVVGVVQLDARWVPLALYIAMSARRTRSASTSASWSGTTRDADRRCTRSPARRA